MKCHCGFKFSKPGEFRNCGAFITDRGESGVICPKCNIKLLNSRDFIPKREQNAKKTRKPKSRNP